MHVALNPMEYLKMVQKVRTMRLAVQNEFATNFPAITFRKKRLTVAIHAYFDMERAEDVTCVKQAIEDALSQLSTHGHAKHTYSVAEV